MIKKLLLTSTAALGLTFGLSTASNAIGVSFCGPVNGTGCEAAVEQKVFLTEGHGLTSDTGGVGAHIGPGVPVMLITTDAGPFDVFFDAGGGFANITASQGFKGFNGLDITIPGFTFTDLVFDVQMNRQGGHKGDSELDTFRINAFSGAHLLDAFNDDTVSPDADMEYSVTALSGAFDEIDLRAAIGSGGFFEIKHLQVSGLEPLVVSAPEPSTWALFGIGFASVGVLALRRRRGMSAA